MDVITRINKTGKIQNICFVKNLILSIGCKFYYDDVTINGMAPFVNLFIQGPSYLSLSQSIYTDDALMSYHGDSLQTGTGSRRLS